MLVHNYLGIDLHRIWTIVELDVPVLKAALQAHPAALHSAQDEGVNHSL